MDDLEPYLELAREIRRDVERLAADDAADAEAIVEAIERFPRDERAKVALAVFDGLSPDAQWAVLERAFGDEEIREHLAAERDARLATLRREGEHRALAQRFRDAGHIDTPLVPYGVTLTLGLFRERDVAAAVQRGARSTTAARRLALRADEGPTFQVVEDVFNPDRGYFVTAGYDERHWRTERLASHQSVEVGRIVAAPSDPPDAPARLDPVLVPGARVDVRTAPDLVQGRLHLGFAILAGDDVFAG